MLDNLSTSQKIAIAVAVPASVALLYLLLKSRDEDDFSSFERSSKNVVIKQQMNIEIKVPQEKVGGIIGREGCVINKIRSDTGARLNFHDHSRDHGDGPRTLVISGKPSSVFEAEQMVQKLIATPPPQTVDILIPNKAVGRIIGAGGTNIRSICRASGARIRIPRSEESPEGQNYRLCTIRGSPEEIASAKAMIEEEIAMEEEKSQRLANASANRKQRNPDKKGATPVPVSQLEQVRFPSHGDYFTVYVSAVEHPNHFWMQIISTKASELDLMVEEMTEFYSQVRNQEAYKQETLCTGDIVAAPFEHDTSWYRAKIIGFLEDDKVDMYFVDYGDYGAIPKTSLFKLRADFLSLPFQAVECTLAGVEPVDEKWPEEAIDLFDDLTHCAEWQPLMARMMGYERTGIKTLPCVDLVDTATEEDVSVAAELIKRGFGRDTRVSAARKVVDDKMKPDTDGKSNQNETPEAKKNDD